MFTDILEVNDYSIIVDVYEIKPFASGTKYEAKVTKIYDHKAEEEISLTPENASLHFGKTEEEAYKKAQNSTMIWAEKQR